MCAFFSPLITDLVPSSLEYVSVDPADRRHITAISTRIKYQHPECCRRSQAWRMKNMMANGVLWVQCLLYHILVDEIGLIANVGLKVSAWFNLWPFLGVETLMFTFETMQAIHFIHNCALCVVYMMLCMIHWLIPSVAQDGLRISITVFLPVSVKLPMLSPHLGNTCTAALLIFSATPTP